MLFCTQQFLVFFLIVFTAYWVTPWPRARVYLLLIASFYFYASWSVQLALLVVGTASLDYWLARGMDAASTRNRARLLCALSISVNLGVLGYFKYMNFFLESLNAAIRESGGKPIPLLSIMVPFGISFYTFEAISYAVDVYQRRLRAERNWANFLLFILFFPHLVAGPIVRGKDFLSQVDKRKRWSWPRFTVGGRLILLGLFKKMVVADRMALLVDPVFAKPEAYSSGVVWLAAIAYSIQIYCDFSGYSDIALGTARTLGYKLTVNFRMPFASANITDFWRRWHISLSNWIRDYVYIPMGGNRVPPLRANFNVLFSMTVCGLWHGASWTFVVWGALNGTYLILHRAFRSATAGITPLRAALESAPGTILRVALTFTATTLAFVIFRSPTFEVAWQVLGRMFAPMKGAPLPVPAVAFWTFAVVVLIAHVIASRPGFRPWWERLPPTARGLALAGLLFVALAFAPETSAMFIYFVF